MNSLSNGMGIKKEKIAIDVWMYAAYCMMIPVNQAMNFSGGGTINRYIGIFVGVLILFRLVIVRKSSFRKDLLILWLFPVWALTTTLWSISERGYTISSFTSLISLFLLFTVCVIRDFNSREKNLIKISMIISGIAVSIWLGYQQAQFWNRTMIVTAGGETDPNGIASCLCFPLLIAFDYATLGSKRTKVLSYVSMVVIAYGMLITGSRGALIAGIVSILLYIWHGARMKIIKSAVIKVIIVVLLMIMVFTFLISFGYINVSTLDRLTVDDLIETGGNGRLDVWLVYLNATFSNPLRMFFGYGYRSDVDVTYMYNGMRMGAHNVFIGHFATCGLIGLLLIILLLVKSYIETINNKDILSRAMLYATIIICMTLDFFLNKALWNVLVFAWVGMGTTLQGGQ